MDIEETPPQTHPPPSQLPYQQTIGLQKQAVLGNSTPGQISQQKWNKQYKYRDIVVPISVRDVSRLYLYYLFHVGPVYNWLRDLRVFGSTSGENQQDKEDIEGDSVNMVRSKGCYQRQVLQQYITNRMKPKTKTNSAPCSSSFSNKQANQQQFHPSTLKQLLIQYARKWQIVRKCIQCKIYITKPSSPSSHTGTHICRHALKTELWTQHYTYNNRTQELHVDRYYCKQCNRYIASNNNYDIREYPLAPILNQYHGQTIVVKTDTTTYGYVLNQVYSSGYVLVRSANGLWYKCDINASNNSNKNKSMGKSVEQVGQMHICNNIGTMLANHTKINNNNGVLYVYVRQEITTNCGILKLATTLNKNRNTITNTHNTHETIGTPNEANTSNKSTIDDIFNTKHTKKNNNADIKITKNKHGHSIDNTQLINMNTNVGANTSASSTFSKRILKQSQNHIQHPNQYQLNIFKHDTQPNQSYTSATTRDILNKQPLPTKQKKQMKQKMQKKRETANQQKQDEHLEDMKDQVYNPYNHIIVDSKLGEAAHKYREEIQKLYLKPKEKDQYEKDYDKGKTKKIKKKHDYIKPNYNQLFKQVKKEHTQTAKIAEQAEKEGLTFRQKQKILEKQKNKSIKKSQGNFKPSQGRQRDRNGKFGGRQSHKKWKKQKKQIFVKKFQQS